MVKRQDAGERPAPLVQRDLDGAPLSEEKATELRQLALEQHKASKYRDEIFGYTDGKYPDPSTDPVFRDSWSSLVRVKVFQEWSAASYARAIIDSGVHIYEFAGWYDGYVNQ